MLRFHLAVCLALLSLAGSGAAQETKPTMKVVLVVHGGAGTIERAEMTPEKEAAYRDGIARALKDGYEVLARGGSSIDAVEAVVRKLEDNPLFNAGKGAVFTSEGTNELDASIMEGKTLRAGAVAGVKHIRNPIALARMVMEKSPHVLLTGTGAEEFAKRMGMELVDQKYFYTDERWQALQKAKSSPSPPSEHDKHGTVGAVALDQAGNLAAATSTGGTTNKLPGRVGDSPIIGAGTYANNQTCAVSCTGDGEYFIRAAVAHTVSDLMEYKGLSLEEAAKTALQKAKDIGGSGGLIAIDKAGHFAMPFNTSGMYRGMVDSRGKIEIKIYR